MSVLILITALGGKVTVQYGALVYLAMELKIIANEEVLQSSWFDSMYHNKFEKTMLSKSDQTP